MMKKTLLVIGGILITVVIFSIIYLLGALTGMIFHSDSYYFVILLLILNGVNIIFNIVNMIIHTIVLKKLAKKKASDLYQEVKQMKEELTDEVETIRENVLKGYKKEYYKIIVIIILTALLIFCNGINYLCLLRLTDDFGLNEAYFTVLIFSLIIPFICLITCTTSYLSKRIDNNNSVIDNSKHLYPKLYEIVENIFIKEGISKQIVINIYDVCNVAIGEDKNKINISISWILLKFLTKKELEAILYHEIGHYKNQDTKNNAILNKYISRLDIFLPMGVQVFYAPFYGKVVYESTIYKNISNVLFERMADDAVLNGGIGDVYADACFKAFALDYASEIDSLDFNLYLNTNYCFDKTLLNMRYNEIYDFYMKHLDFFLNVSQKHLPLQFSTHPTIKERIEKFSSGGKIDTVLCNNKEYDDEILNSFEKMNNELKSNLKLQNEYKEAKSYFDSYVKYRDEVIAKDLNVDDNVLASLIEDAMGFYDYDFAKKACYKILENDSNNSRFNLLLGGLLFHMDLSNDCIPYLEKVANDKDSMYRDNACQLLLEYYTYTGQKEEKDKIRKLTLEVMDGIYATNPVDELRVGDKYEKFKNEEIINYLIKKAREISTIKYIWVGTKRIKGNYCHHVIVYTDSNEKDQEIHKEIGGYLDLKNDRYKFYIFKDKQMISTIYKKICYFVYIRKKC